MKGKTYFALDTLLKTSVMSFILTIKFTERYIFTFLTGICQNLKGGKGEVIRGGKLLC